MLSQVPSPYTPPNASLEPDPEARVPGTGRFSIGVAFSEAWATTWANFPLWLGAGIVWFVATGLATLTIVGIFLAVPVLGWGLTRFCLGMHDRQARFGDVFSGFSRYGTALGAILPVLLVTVGASLPGQVLAQVGMRTHNMTYSGVGALLNFAVGILVTSRWLFAQFLVVDQGLGGRAALRRSWQLTRPVRWRIVGLMIAGSLMMLVGALCLLVGVLPASVIFYQMVVSAYRQVVGGPQSAAA